MAESGELNIGDTVHFEKTSFTPLIGMGRTVMGIGKICKIDYAVGKVVATRYALEDHDTWFFAYELNLIDDTELNDILF